MNSVAEESARLIRERDGELPKARELTKATGYSIGTIYAHFGSLRGIVRHIVYLRRAAVVSRIEGLIDAHDPNLTASYLCNQIVEEIFNSLKNYPQNLVRKMYQIALSDSDRASELDRVADCLAPAILNAISRDQSGSFKTTNHQEIIFFMRGMMAIVRSPLLDNLSSFASPQHIEITKSYLKNLFSKIS